MERKYPVLQGLMDVAYDRWKEHQSWTQADFYSQLKPVEALATLTGNLNYQVENGGFLQWYFNGYGENAVHYLIEQLPKMGPKGMVVSQILTEVERIRSDWEPEVEVWVEDEYWDGTGETGESDGHYEIQPNEEGPDIERFDNLYYDLNDALMVEVEAVLQKPHDEIIALLEAPSPLPVPAELLPPTPALPILKGPIDGNIFAVMGAASRVLKRAGKRDEAKQMQEEVVACKSYDMALATVMNYVEIQV